LLFTTPLLFALLFAFYGFIFCLLIVLSVYDLKHKILPDELSAFFAAAALIGAFIISGQAIILHIPNVWNVLAGILLPLPFIALWYFSKGKWMGLGDPKLMIGIGFLLGMSAGITAVLISFWVGAIVGILTLIFAPLFSKKNVSMKTAVPFGPFLALGTMITFFAGLDFLSIIRMLGNLS
jgi:prepilin signal peptidase PulO-like enzyme (type II secretory pathway)